MSWVLQESVVERLSWELTVYETMKTQAQEKVVLLMLGAGRIKAYIGKI
jgi:hypothetical protein